MDDIVHKQIQFQIEVGYPIDSKKEADLTEMSEKYIFKAIEELVELRKEFPSVMNPWSKEQKTADRSRILEELAGVLLFIMNFAAIWKISDTEILETIKFVQERNFTTLKRKKLDQFNESVLKLPGYKSGIGQGAINPKYIFVGQNPSKNIPHGYEVWKDEHDGSSQVLVPAINKLNIAGVSYFTNLVKSTTPNNEEPSDKLVEFWFPKLQEELRILMINNPSVKLILMGSFVAKWMKAPKIPHPAYVLRGGMTHEDYVKEIEKAIK